MKHQIRLQIEKKTKFIRYYVSLENDFFETVQEFFLEFNQFGVIEIVL